MQENLIKYSICFCTRNEELNIGYCLDDALENIPKIIGDQTEYEIIVIDNASNDNTPKIVKTYKLKHPQIKLIQHTTNKLYSGSYVSALKFSKGEYIAILDGDYQHTCKDLYNFIKLMNQKNCDVVFGWKKNRNDNYLRIIFSAGFRLVSKIILNHDLNDINCGYRLFRNTAAQKITISEMVNSVGPEIYMEISQLNLVLGEVIVNHFSRKRGASLHGTISGLLKNSGIFTLYMLRLRKKYNKRKLVKTNRLCK